MTHIKNMISFINLNETLQLSDEPYERPSFIPLVDASRYGEFYGWTSEDAEDTLLLKKGETALTITPSDGMRTSKGSLAGKDIETQEINAVKRDGKIYISLDTAMSFLKP